MALSEYMSGNNREGSHSHGSGLDEFSSLEVFVGHNNR
jgi:hypothetical protein